MTNRAPTPPYSESFVSDYKTPHADDKTEMSEAAMKELIARQVEPLWKALGDAMKERTEMKLRIDELESSETNLKNLVENVTLNNERLIDEVEKMRIENAGLRRPSNENEIFGETQQLTIESKQATHSQVALKCGHKFDKTYRSDLASIKRCPICNQPASEGDFREMYNY